MWIFANILVLTLGISHAWENQRNNLFFSYKNRFVNLLTKSILVTASTLSFLDLKKVEADTTTTNDAISFVDNLQRERKLLSDEFEISFEKDSLGLSIRENFYAGFPVLTVEDFRDSYPQLRKGAIITRIAGKSVDGLPLATVFKLIQNNPRPLNIRFRDPSRYFELLDSVESIPLKVITTSYLPANARDAGASEQIITVERLKIPPAEERRRSAQLLDVMELQYAATIAGDDTNRIVDSSAEHCPPGSSTKSIYYVLGQRNGPPGTFPPGWDLTLRGMVVGEKRRITLPYTLAYERKGDKDRGIPPFATIVYTVKMISLT